MKRRDLTPEEAALWKAAAHGEKLEKKTGKEPAEAISAHPSPARPAVSGAIIKGSTDNIDRRTAQRFKRGQMPIEASLDLHGFTRADAQDAFSRFIQSAYAQGRRCVLVITGKGRADGQGVLKSELPRWVNMEALAPLILAFTHAQTQHGGTGAFYVLLKRKRRD